MNTGKGIEIAENKVLKLNRVVSREIGSQDQGEMQKIMQMFDSYFKSKKITPYGPLIIYSKTSFDKGIITQKTKMMVQVKEAPEKIDAPYSFDDLIRVEGCLMARYKGDQSSIQMAYGKMQVYAFENDITLKDEAYTVFVEQTDEGILADVFVEVMK